MRRIQLVVISFAMALSVNAQTLPYLDESRSIEERVEDLLSRLTVDEKIDLMRATSPANERLGFPKYYHGNEALHGVVRPGKFTVYPQAIGLASTWNPTLLNTISTAISDEARARWNELERGKKQTNKPVQRLADILVANGEHGPRPTMGTYSRDIRRRPVPDR